MVEEKILGKIIIWVLVVLFLLTLYLVFINLMSATMDEGESPIIHNSKGEIIGFNRMPDEWGGKITKGDTNGKTD